MKLNYRKFILAFGVSALSITSCQDIVEIPPTDLIVEEIALQNLADLDAATTGAYAALTGGGYYGGSQSVVPDWTSDDLIRSDGNQGQGVFFYNSVYDPSQTNGVVWNAAYNVLNRANIVLSRIDAIEGDQTVKNNLKGELLFLRALAHFDLVRFFAGNYSPDAPGIPLQLTPPTPNQVPSRNTQAEVYQSIVTDITDAIPLLTVNKGVIKASPAAARALLTKVRLYQGDFAGVIAAGESIMGSDPAAPLIALPSGNDYTAMWRSNENTQEVIFKLAMPVGSAAIGNNYWAENNDIPYFSPSQDLLGLYDRANDVRFNAFFNPRSETDPNETDDLVVKFRGNALNSNALPANPGLVDIKVFRASEVALSLAEAHFEQGNEGTARAWLDLVRRARITGFSNGTETGNALEQAIRTERRKELAHEGHRFFDLRRWNEPVIRGADCNSANCELPAGNFRFVFPIPQDEMFANENMVQNEGYQ